MKTENFLSVNEAATRIPQGSRFSITLAILTGALIPDGSLMVGEKRRSWIFRESRLPEIAQVVAKPLTASPAERLAASIVEGANAQ